MESVQPKPAVHPKVFGETIVKIFHKIVLFLSIHSSNLNIYDIIHNLTFLENTVMTS